ncbi:PTS sugar transporter subunit IIA [Amphibacillus sp. Q70]|uniref:PTS sugar transporter subunit IIA n=1 Tax=Amphibacillus sp. Q70 TaxID=3453416 RepID=UPI003F873EED
MPKKYDILLLTHGEWGGSLLSNLKMIVGNAPGAYSIPLMSADTFNDYYSRVEEKIKSLNSSVLVLTDLYGGTTSNVALKLTQKYNLKIISGLNAGLLLEAVSNQQSELNDHLVRELLEASLNNCKVLSINIKS